MWHSVVLSHIHLLIIFTDFLTPQQTEQFCLYCPNTYGGHYIQYSLHMYIKLVLPMFKTWLQSAWSHFQMQTLLKPQRQTLQGFGSLAGCLAESQWQEPLGSCDRNLCTMRGSSEITITITWSSSTKFKMSPVKIHSCRWHEISIYVTIVNNVWDYGSN